MFAGIDHVVIAVKDLEAAVSTYETIFGKTVSDRKEIAESSMRMAYFRFDDSYVELVSSIGDEGPIAKRLAGAGEGVHIVAMKVADLAATVAHLRDKGLRLVGDPGPDKPITGQVFIHPSVTGGVLTQIVQQ